MWFVATGYGLHLAFPAGARGRRTHLTSSKPNGPLIFTAVFAASQATSGLFPFCCVDCLVAAPAGMRPSVFSQRSGVLG